ncbi:MAG: hypothetical protein QOF76_67 [Solirubrobacteraceae bacterium]|jgi:hypothetical protein|nr:hypothetical protein [Solirubrobacteraceae bacterium]
MTTLLGPADVEAQFFAGIRQLMIGRTALEAPLLDVPGKMILGNYALAHKLPDFVDLLEERATAEELGLRAKRLGVQMGIGIPSLMWIYVLGRLQRHLDAGWPHNGRLDDDAEATRVYDFYARAMSTYRSDDRLVPQGGNGSGWPVLTASDAADLAARALARGPVQDVPKTRRANAQLEAFVFMLHADAREGMLYHGPYDLGDGTILLVKEYSDLQNLYLPWGPDHQLDVSCLVLAIVLENVECSLDVVTGLHIEPHDYIGAALGYEILAGDDLESISEAEWAAHGESTKPILKDLLRYYMTWDDRMKVLHGCAQYGNVMRGWMEAAGYTEAETRKLIIEPMEEAGAAYADRLIAKDYPPIWEYIASEEEPLLPGIRS